MNILSYLVGLFVSILPKTFNFGPFDFTVEGTKLAVSGSVKVAKG